MLCYFSLLDFKHLQEIVQCYEYIYFLFYDDYVLFQSHDEDLEKDETSQNCLERDVEQVVKRLGMAHDEIQRLTDELQGKEKEQSKLGKLWLQMNVSDYSC